MADTDITRALAKAREAGNLAYGYFVALVNHGGETEAAAKKGRDHLQVALAALASAEKTADAIDLSDVDPDGSYLQEAQQIEADRFPAPDAARLTEALHVCYVANDPDDDEIGHYRPCPPELCQAEWLLELARGLVGELEERRACLVGAHDDLERIVGASVEDGGLWIRAVAGARAPLVAAAIAETDKALAVAGSLAAAAGDTSEGGEV